MTDSDSIMIATAGKFLSDISGGVISEVSQLIALPVREFRLKQTLKVSLRARELLEEHGIKPEQLSGELRTIIPILESAADEDDPTLQEMWATLLATSVMPDFKGAGEPDFHKLLAQLSPSQARLLKGFYEGEVDQSHLDLIEDKLHHIAQWLEIPDESCKLLLMHLWSLNLLYGPDLQRAAVTWGGPSDYELSELGAALMERCTFFESEVE